MHLSICNYVDNNDNYELYHDIIAMFEKYKNTLLRGLSLYNYIQNNNPSLIIKEHKESVKLYYLSQMSNSTATRAVSSRNLRINLRKFRDKELATLQNMRSIRRYTIRRRVEEVINSANTDNFIMTNNEGAGEGNIENDESDTTVDSNDSDDLEENKENSSSDDESKNDSDNDSDNENDDNENNQDNITNEVEDDGVGVGNILASIIDEDFQ